MNSEKKISGKDKREKNDDTPTDEKKVKKKVKKQKSSDKSLDGEDTESGVKEKKKKKLKKQNSKEKLKDDDIKTTDGQVNEDKVKKPKVKKPKVKNKENGTGKGEGDEQNDPAGPSTENGKQKKPKKVKSDPDKVDGGEQQGEKEKKKKLKKQKSTDLSSSTGTNTVNAEEDQAKQLKMSENDSLDDVENKKPMVIKDDQSNYGMATTLSNEEEKGELNGQNAEGSVDNDNMKQDKDNMVSQTVGNEDDLDNKGTAEKFQADINKMDVGSRERTPTVSDEGFAVPTPSEGPTHPEATPKVPNRSTKNKGLYTTLHKYSRDTEHSH